ncbi:MAG TPA: hypothetical protein VFS00_17465 [Polyangiaceae bacterium]|nr:hypothetical protein [Polyangiaceae bacterium]
MAAALTACGGSIRVVDQGHASGELALVGDRQEARVHAGAYMGQHCPKGYRVLNDGKTIVPERPAKIGTSEGRLGVAGPSPDAMQWRVRYECQLDNRSKPPLVDPNQVQAAVSTPEP